MSVVESLNMSRRGRRRIKLVTLDEGITRVRVYTNFMAIYNTYVKMNDNTSDEETQDTTRSLVASAMYQVLPSLESPHVIYSEIAGPKADQTQTINCLQLGFGAICHITKPITGKNKEYLSKRWKTLDAVLLSKGYSMGPYIFAAHLTKLLEYIPDLSVIIPSSEIVNALRDTALGPDIDPIRTCINVQLSLIYDLSQMTSNKLMADFFRHQTNGSLALVSVVTDLERYKTTYNVLRHAIGEADCPFARALHTARLGALEGRKFPDLYTAAMEAATTSEGFSKENYTVSSYKHLRK